MTTSGRQAQAWMVAALVFGVIGPVRAADTSPSYADGALGKLGRGVANVLTCPLELIRTPTLVAREHGTIAGLTVGLVKGIGQTLVRGVAGVVEVVTCPLRVPAKDFAPLVTPEFVWAHGNWSE